MVCPEFPGDRLTGAAVSVEPHRTVFQVLFDTVALMKSTILGFDVCQESSPQRRVGKPLEEKVGRASWCHTAHVKDRFLWFFAGLLAMYNPGPAMSKMI